MKDKRKLIVVGVILLILLVLSGILALSKGIVSKSYSAVDYVENRSIAEEESRQSIPVETEVPDKEFIDEDDLSKAKAIYDTTNIVTRQKKFLGEYYDEYKDVLGKIEKDSKDICSTLQSGRVNDSLNILKLHGASSTASLGYKDLEGFSSVSISNNALTAIGLYNDTYIVCAFNYPNNKDKFLICIDFSEHLFSTSTEGKMYDFGSYVSAFIIPSEGKLETYDDWTVLYVKG